MSEQAFEQGDPGFDAGGEAGDPYGPDWDGDGGFEHGGDPAEFDAAVQREVAAQRQRELDMFEERLAELEPLRQWAESLGERERMAQASAEAQEIVAGHAAELGFEQASFEQIEESASGDVYAVAVGLLEQAGYPRDAAATYLAERGDLAAFEVVGQAYGLSTREVAKRALAAAMQRAFAAGNTTGDESAMLARYQRRRPGRRRESGRRRRRRTRDGPWTCQQGLGGEDGVG